MSQRLFRFSDLMSEKYEILSLGVKHRPKSQAQIRREKESLERLKQQKELENLDAKEDALKDAKSNFINFVNTYMNPSDILIENKYSPLSQGGRVGKQNILRELYTLGSPEAKAIFKILDELFPGSKPDGDLDFISLTKLSNRVNKIYDILNNEDTMKNMATLLRARLPQDFMTEGIGNKISLIDGMIQAARDLLPNIIAVFSLFSQGKEPIDPKVHEHIESEPLWRSKTNFRLGMHGVSDETWEWMGINSDEDFQIANNVDSIRPIFNRVMMQTKHGPIIEDPIQAMLNGGRKYPKDGPLLKQMIQEYKNKQRSNIGVLERPMKPPPSPLLHDFLEEQKTTTGPSNIKRTFSPEELEEIYEAQKQREAKERGEGSGEGSF